MKKLLIIALSLLAINAFAGTPRVSRHMNLLGPEMRARIESGEMKVVDIVVVQGAAPKVQNASNGEAILSSVSRPLVIERSCRASMFYEGSQYDYDEECADGGSCDCDETVTVEYKTANIAVDVRFDTDFSYETASITIDLIAIDRLTGGTSVITSEYYSQETNLFGNGDNTVVFNIDDYYYQNYNLEARVSIGDSAGSACTVYSNSI